LRAFLPGTPSLGDDAARTIEPMILEVARVEGPLHFETLIERLRMRYGMARARQSTRTHLVRILGAMASRGVISVLRRDAGEDLFVALPGTPAHPRGPGIMGIRRALHVAPEELAAGLRALFVAERGGYRDDLIRKAAREFGWTRTGDDVYAVLDAALDSLLRSGEVRERYGRLELSGSAAMGLDSASTSPANR
jgi:hypothetical protein